MAQTARTSSLFGLGSGSGLGPTLLMLVACNGRGCGCGRDDTGQGCAEADRHIYYLDADGDGFGDALEVTEACEAPDGYVDNAGDCADDDLARVDMVALWVDADGDGYGVGEPTQVCEGEPGYSDRAGDCDDGDGAVFPGAEVVADNGKDDDCDGLSDAALPEGSGIAQDADVRISGSGEEELGTVVLGLADMGDDGVGEIALGAPEASGTGMVYVVLSPFDDTIRSVDVDVVLSGNGLPMRAGASLATADLTADGLADLVVGCADEATDDGGSSVYVVAGPVTSSAVLEPADDLFFLRGTGGDAVVAGDLIGGDDLDLIAWRYDTDQITGARGPISRSYDETEDLYGIADFNPTDGPSGLAFIGDATGEGDTDLIIGRPDYSVADEVALSDAGAVYLTDDSGFLSGDSDLIALVVGPSTDSLFGQVVVPAGDIDGDGLADFAVGAPGFYSDIGAVYVFSSADVLATPEGDYYLASDTTSIRLRGAVEDGQFGTSLAGGVDLDGDGNTDLAVGAPEAEEGQGAVYLWYGPLADMGADEADLTLTGEGSGDRFGASIDLSQDLNGLGRLDLVVGAPGANDGDGAVYVFFMDGL